MNRLEKLKEAKSIIDQYAQKCSTIDEGNLYFAATQFEFASAEYEKIIAELEGALLDCELELLTIDDHVNYGKMERYYSPERSQQLGKLIFKSQSALKKLNEFRG